MSVTALHVLNKKEFEPIVRIEENVKLLVDRTIYGKVVFLEQIPPQIIDLGSINAPTPINYPATGTSRKLTELELGEREFGQWRIIPIDDVLVQIRIPSAMGRFVTKTGSIPVSKLTAVKEQLAEVYTYKDYVPLAVPFNPNFTNLDMSRILVYGYRYVFEPLDTVPKDYTVIPIYGIPTTGR